MPPIAAVQRQSNQRTSATRLIAACLAIAGAASLTLAGSASATAGPYKPVRTIKLTGELVGKGYEVASSARLYTSKEHKETWVVFDIARLGGEGGHRTPLVDIELNGTKLECSTFKSWIWSTDKGSKNISAKCDGYLSPKKAKKVKVGTVSSL